MITDYANQSILKRAQEKECIRIQTVNPRDFADDKRKTIDDTPYGGGAGMIMKPEPIHKALKSIDAIPFSKTTGLNKIKRIVTGKIAKKKRTVVLSPRGRQFDQALAQQWSQFDEITFICGRYEGIDQRVIDHMVDEEVSVGPYVLAGGELGALIMIEAVSRLIPGVLGNEDSIKEETFSVFPSKDTSNQKQIEKEYPQYTKPANFLGWEVPKILLSGDHKRIEKWRREKMEE